MSYIVVSVFDHEDDAGNVHNFLRDANLIDLNDSAVVYKDKGGKVHIKNETYLGKQVGTLGGGMLGLLIGGVLFPVGGLVIGAVAGRLIGKKVSADIDQGFIKDVTSRLSPGNSALFVIVRGDTPQDALDTMKKYEGDVYYTSVPAETETQLRQALSGFEGKPLEELGTTQE